MNFPVSDKGFSRFDTVPFRYAGTSSIRSEILGTGPSSKPLYSEVTTMKSSAFPDPRGPLVWKGWLSALLSPSLKRSLDAADGPHHWSPAPLHQAVLTVRRDIAAGLLEVHPFVGGERGEVMVPAGDHLLVLHPSRPGLRAVYIRHERIVAWCSRLAAAGAGLLAVAWVLVFAAGLSGRSLFAPALFGALAVVLFMTPLGVTLALTQEPIPLSRQYRLVEDVEMAIRDALTRGPMR